MSEEDNKIEESVDETTETKTFEQESIEETSSTDEENNDPVEQAVNDRLTKMKSNMDRMVKERDEALKKPQKLNKLKSKVKLSDLKKKVNLLKLLK